MDRDLAPAGEALLREDVSDEQLDKLIRVDHQALRPCWCCKATLCACTSPHPFKLRLIEQCAMCFMWWAGMYADGQGRSEFSRERWEKIETLTRVPPIPQDAAAQGVYSVDKDIPDADGGLTRVRVFLHTTPASSSRPVLVYFHGGGFCINHYDTKGMDALCLQYAQQGFVVISVEYRLAPEHPFPTPVRDCYAAVRWVVKEGRRVIGEDCDPAGKLVLSGDSAGGNLALVVGSLLRDGLDADLGPSEFPDLRAQHLVLMYPGLYYIPGAADLETQRTRYFLVDPVLRFFSAAYVPGDIAKRKETLKDRRLSPLVAGVHGLPRCTVVVALDDALRPGGEKLIEKLQKANVPVKAIRGNSAHGFFSFDFVSETQRCKQAVFDDLAYLAEPSEA